MSSFNKVFSMFLLIFLAESVYSMEEKSLSDTSENKNLTENIKEIDLLENSGKTNQVLDLRKIAFKKVLKIWQNDLTLENEPDRLLKLSPALLDEIKSELILLNSAAWWNCFGDKAQSIDLDLEGLPHFANLNNNLLTIYSINEKKYKFIILDANEIIVKCSFDIDLLFKLRLEGLDSIVQLEYVNKKLNIKDLKISEVFPEFISQIEQDFVKGEYLTTKENERLEYFYFGLRNPLGKIGSVIYYIPVKNIEEPILDIDKYLSVLKSSYFFQNFSPVSHFPNMMLKGCHDSCSKHEDTQFNVKKPYKKEIAVTGSTDQNIKIWDLDNLECIKTIKLNYSQKKFQLSEDGSLIFTRLSSKTAALFDIETGKPIQIFSSDLEISSRLFINLQNTSVAIASNFENSSKIKVYSIDSILNKLNIGQLTLIKLLYNNYKTNNCTEIGSNSGWNQILKSFDPDVQQLIFEKFNLKISCDN